MHRFCSFRYGRYSAATRLDVSEPKTTNAESDVIIQNSAVSRLTMRSRRRRYTVDTKMAASRAKPPSSYPSEYPTFRDFLLVATDGPPPLRRPYENGRFRIEGRRSVIRRNYPGFRDFALFCTDGAHPLQWPIGK